MPKVTKTAAVPQGVTLSVEDAEQIYKLYENVQLADVHFHSCQSPLFRQHIQSVYKAQNVGKAFDNLRDAMLEAKGG